MAGHKAKIDKDSNEYLSKGSQPDSERETAYDSNDSIAGIGHSTDRNGNDDTVFQGSTKKDKTRKADQATTGATGIGDTGTGLSTESRFYQVIKNRFYVAESENPSVATSPTTSDNPTMGLYGMASGADPKKDIGIDVRTTLEGIALQAAQTFELLEHSNIQIPDTTKNELKQAFKVVDNLFDVVSGSSTSVPNNPDSKVPVHKDSDSRLPVKEHTMKYRIQATPLHGEPFISEKMSLKTAQQHFNEMVETDQYASIEITEATKKDKTKKLAKGNAKSSMMESAMSILENHKLFLRG
jgi:hypothetical protein